MKKYVFFFLISISFSSYSQQVWIDSNATWHYDQTFIGDLGFLKFEYLEDEMVGGQLCQKITQTRYEFGHTAPPEYELVFIGANLEATYHTYVSGDTVFYYDNGEFFVLYNFGADPGDQWIISTTNTIGDPYCSDTSIVEVLDTGTMVINAQTYRTIDLAPVGDSPFELYGTYVERFGLYNTGMSFHYLFPRGSVCDSNIIVDYYFTEFRCFEDNSFPLLNEVGEDCEYLLTHLSLPEDTSKPLRIYPNPVQNELFIDVPEGDYTAKIIDFTGKEVTSEHLVKAGMIDVTQLVSGNYFILLISNSGESFKGRFTKS